MVKLHELEAVHRRGVLPDGRTVTPQEREQLLKPFLPPVEQSTPLHKAQPRRSKPVRGFLKSHLYFLIFTIVHAFFSVYVRFRIAYHAVVNRIFAVLYHHHRAPEYIQKDVKGLSRLPKHLSVSLDFIDDERNGGGLEGLVNDVSEIAAWCASAGIPVLSIYERTGSASITFASFLSFLLSLKLTSRLPGILKNYIPQTHRSISRTLESYFGLGPRKPTLSLRAPHLPSFSPPTTPPLLSSDPSSPSSPPHLTVLLISADDGRNTLVDLTKTLVEMAQRQKLSASDVSADLIDAEISESVMGEPDLLVLFGPRVELKGYPPWQIRLTEIL